MSSGRGNETAGSEVVPRPIRDELGFGPGRELELSVVDGRLQVELPLVSMRLEEREGDLVAVADEQLPPLTVYIAPARPRRARLEGSPVPR